MIDCGACGLCCRLLAVPDIQKAAGHMCKWTTIHGGCERHAEKTTAPELLACAQFRCLWLDSQTHPDPSRVWPMVMRPDWSHVVFGPEDPEDDRLIYVHVDPNYPSAWTKEMVRAVINEMLDKGLRVHVEVGDVEFTLGGEGMPLEAGSAGIP